MKPNWRSVLKLLSRIQSRSLRRRSLSIIFTMLFKSEMGLTSGFPAEVRMKVGFSGKHGDVAVLLRRNLSTSRPAALEMSPWALKSPLELKSPARMIP
jgi:hypothetical protein